MSASESDSIELNVNDGSRMGAYVARPSGPGPHPGILVFQEIFGVNTHIRSVADRYAAAGFVAVAPDLFHRTSPGFQSGYDNMSLGVDQARAMTEAGLEADVVATYEWLKSDAGTVSNRIASVGFCMGGRVSFLANALLPLRAAISYYGGGIAPGLLRRAGEQHGPLLLFWGGLDGHTGPDQRRAAADALTEAGKSFVNVLFSQANHGFFCDVRASYNPDAAEQSWALAQAFLASHCR
jgi:carboxymethylenebutenolidase